MSFDDFRAQARANKRFRLSRANRHLRVQAGGTGGMVDAEWVRKFCLGGQEARIKVIAEATPAAHRAA